MPSDTAFGFPTPILRVRDVDASLDYYIHKLGFQQRWRHNTDFACVARDHCSLFITTDEQSQPRMWVWLGVADCHATHAELAAKGARIRNPPSSYDWALEMQVEDLDGNVLRIGSDPVEGQTEFDGFLDANYVRWSRQPDGSYKGKQEEPRWQLFAHHSVAHVQDAVANGGGFHVVRDHQDGLAEFTAALKQHR